MPELPEVEIVCRGLNDAFVGHRLTKVIRRFGHLRWPIPDDLEQMILRRPSPGAADGAAGSAAECAAEGVTGILRSVQRRSKYLLLGFDTGTLLIHLGMSGTLRRLAAAEPVKAHDHVDFVFGDQVLRFNDPRRFGAVLWYDAADTPGGGHRLLQHLGVEPFSEAFSGRLMFDATRGRKASIKQVLLSGAIVVGVGNIYASESLFRARIRPTTAAGRISRPRYERLADAIRQTLTEAIAAGGSTLRDFVASTGQSGYFQLQCFVYGRAGEACRVCATPIRGIRQQQRATFFCPTCQKP